jgi:hypothetical protein
MLIDKFTKYSGAAQAVFQRPTGLFYLADKNFLDHGGICLIGFSCLGYQVFKGREISIGFPHHLLKFPVQFVYSI